MPAAVVTTTETVLPIAVSSGTCKLIWVGLTKARYAGFPSMVTLVPPSEVGKSPFQEAVSLAR
jgi:hypothetical protein